MELGDTESLAKSLHKFFFSDNHTRNTYLYLLTAILARQTNVFNDYQNEYFQFCEKQKSITSDCSQKEKMDPLNKF